MTIEETAKVGSAPLPGQEIATADRDPFNWVWDGLLRPNDDTLLTRGQGRGLKIYDELERDAHCYAVLQKRKLAVVGREWTVEPASTSRADKKAAATVEAAFKALPFDQLCCDLLDATLKGYAVSEIVWRAAPDGVLPQAVLARDQRRFVFDVDHRPRLLTQTDQIKGDELPDRKFIVHRFGAKDGNPYGLGLGTRLFWPVFFKRQGISFWLTFADKFGSPTALGKYPAGVDAAARTKLLAALRAIAQEACVTVPMGMEIELLEAQRGGSFDGYESLCRYLDEQISTAVLGEIHTTGGGESGMGGGRDQVANDVRLELTRADADLLAGTLNATLVRWITEFNHPGATPPRLWWDVSEPEDLKARADRDKVLSDIGLEMDDEYLAETYPGWRRKAAPQGGDGAAPPKAADALAELAERLAPPPSRDAADDLTDQAEREGDAAVDALLSPIERLFKNATSLEEIRDGLEKINPDLDDAALAKLLREGMAAAWLTGRFDVKVRL